jgi:hypothetical protein
MAKANDPFAELTSRERRVTPRVLRGKKKEIWEQFVKRYHSDQFAGLSINELFEWAKKHCGLNCSLSCFRQELMNGAKD